MIRCTLCRRDLRIPMFPFNLFFWRPRALLYTFDLVMGEDEYKVMTALCPKDLEYTQKNQVVAEQLITTRIQRMEENL